MARRKTTPELVHAKCSLAERLREVRAELFGERGGPELARRLGIPVRTWYNYEAGVTVPAEVVLRIILMTSLEPGWLLCGHGPKFQPTNPVSADPSPGADLSVRALLRTALQRLEQGAEADRNTDGYPGLPGLSAAMKPGPRAGGAIHDGADGAPGPLAAGPKVAVEGRELPHAWGVPRLIRVVGDAMAPLVSDGAFVAFAKSEEPPAQLDGKLVVSLGEDPPIVRWFQDCGRYALLRAEDLHTEPVLIDLEERPGSQRFLRVLWVNTPH